jgi:hypothetical protein
VAILAPNHVTGRYATAAAARAAVARVDALHFDVRAVQVIDLTDDRPSPAEDRSGHPVAEVAKQAGAGATLGAAAGAAAGVAAAFVTGDAGTGTAVAAVAAAGGTVVGGLAGGIAHLPTHEAAWTVYEGDPGDPHPITVRVQVAGVREAELVRTALRPG